MMSGENRSTALIGAGCAAILCLALAGATPAPQFDPYTESIEGTTVAFDMVPVAGGTIAASEVGGESGTIEVAPFWIGKTEVTWDEFDIWMLGLDVEPERRAGIDASSRPSRPYGAPDRGFGHAGYGAISITYQSAQRYAEWLSAKTGRVYRLPTWAEWQLACLADLGVDDASADRSAALEAARAQRAWHAGNTDNTTEPVASKPAGSLGIHDMLGNVGEWVTNPNGEPALHGGTYRDDPAALSCATRAEQTWSWNERDPQIPKSTWWLSDGPFAGFRLVREVDP